MNNKQCKQFETNYLAQTVILYIINIPQTFSHIIFLPWTPQWTNVLCQWITHSSVMSPIIWCVAIYQSVLSGYNSIRQMKSPKKG